MRARTAGLVPWAEDPAPPGPRPGATATAFHPLTAYPGSMGQGRRLDDREGTPLAPPRPHSCLVEGPTSAGGLGPRRGRNLFPPHRPRRCSPAPSTGDRCSRPSGPDGERGSDRERGGGGTLTVTPTTAEARGPLPAAAVWGTRPGQVPGLGASHSCAGSSGGRSSGSACQNSGTSRRSEAEGATPGVRQPGFQTPAQPCVGAARRCEPARHGHAGARGQRRPDTHVFVLTGEARAVQLVHGHDHGHDVFAVHDGGGQDVPCHVVGELVCEGAEVGVL